MFCISCGTKMPDEARFCAKCGRSTIEAGAPKGVPELPPSVSVPTTAAAAAPTLEPLPKAPYGGLVFDLICFSVTAGGFVFLMGSAIAQATPAAFSNPRLGGASLIGVNRAAPGGGPMCF